MARKTNTTSISLRSALQASLLGLLAVLPFAYVGVQAGYIPGYETTYTVPQFYVFEVGVLIAFVLWAILRRPSLSDVRWYWPLFVLVALGFASAAWAVLPTLAIVISAHLAIAVLLIIVLADEFRDQRFLKAALTVLVGGAALQAIWGITQYVVQHDLGLQLLGESVLRSGDPNVAHVPGEARPLIRAYGGLPHPNVLAAYLASGLFITVAGSFARRWRGISYQLALGALLGLLGTAFLYTYSRTPWVAVSITLLGVISLAIHRRRTVPLGLLVGGVVVVVAALLAQQSLSARSNPTNVADVAVPDRVVQHDVAKDLILDQPYGTGIGNYSPAADRRRPELTGYQLQPVHNTLILIVAELGVLGGVLALLFMVRLLSRTRREVSRLDPDLLTLAAGGFLVAAIAMMLTDHFFWTLPQGMWLLSVLLGLLVSRLPRHSTATGISRTSQ